MSYIIICILCCSNNGQSDRSYRQQQQQQRGGISSNGNNRRNQDRMVSRKPVRPGRVQEGTSLHSSQGKHRPVHKRHRSRMQVSQDQTEQVSIKYLSYLYVIHLKSFLICKLFFRSYLILGVEDEEDLPGLAVSSKTIIIEWRDEWHRRMRRLQKRAGRCY